MDKDEKPKLNLPKKIELGYSSLQGRGVFATEDIVPGEIVERAPLVVMGFRMNYHKDPVIWNYMFTNTCPCDDCKKHGGHFLMVMGYGQIYNHQDDNSAEIRFDLKNQIADIRAVKKIKKGQEIFVNYGPNYFKNKQKITIESPAQPSSQIKDQIPPIKPPTMMETPVVEIKDKQVYRPL